MPADGHERAVSSSTAGRGPHGCLCLPGENAEVSLLQKEKHTNKTAYVLSKKTQKAPIIKNVLPLGGRTLAVHDKYKCTHSIQNHK